MNPTDWRARVAALVWAAAVAVAMRGVSGSINTLSSLAWLRAARAAHPVRGAQLFIVLILPVLREQRILAGTVEYFAELAKQHGHSVVVLVTTEREHHEPDRARADDPLMPTTVEVAGTLAAQTPSGVVRHLHYPDAEGVMADQVNFAASAELARLTEDGIDPQRVWIAVYNADSRPCSATLDHVARLADAGLPRPRIMQQSALFTTNQHAFPPVSGGRCCAGRRWCSPGGHWPGRSLGCVARHARRAKAACGGRGWRTAWGMACSCGVMSSSPGVGCRPRR